MKCQIPVLALGVGERARTSLRKLEFLEMQNEEEKYDHGKLLDFVVFPQICWERGRRLLFLCLLFAFRVAP
jgi:hypothetical protein